MNTKAKPFIKWVGGKGQLIEQLEAKLPADFDNWDDATYIEPFVGGGAMLFYMLQQHPNIKRAVINDINSDLVTCYRTVRDNVEELIPALQDIQAQYYALQDMEAKREMFMAVRQRYNEKNLDPNSWQYSNCQAGKYAYCGNTDWMKEMYKKSYPVQKYNININGGSEKATYYTSVGYTDQGSLLRYGNENYRKFNMVNNINYDINDWLHVSMKTSFIRTELNGIPQDNAHGETWIGNDTQPLMPIKHPDGNWSGQGNYTNFAAVLEEGGSRKTTNNDFWNTMALKLTPIKGMTINMDYTFNYYAQHIKNHLRSFNEYGIDGKFLQTFQWTNPNYIYEHQQNDTYNAFNLFGDYEKTLGKHYFKVMLGFNQETKHTRAFYAQRNSLISNDLPSMDAATGEKYVGNSDDSWATRSGFFRVNYTFADRYLLEVNGRYDLSSKFPKSDRSVFSPSFSLGWKLSEEKWFKEPTNSFFDDLKIRASYGSLPPSQAPLCHCTL